MSTPSPQRRRTPRRPRRAADLRRSQLLEVAAEIIEHEGADALRPAHVAELAGCTRTLVYHYFPRREDLLIAIAADFYASLDERLSREDQARAIPAAAHGDFTTAQDLHEAIWDLIEEKGPAASILRATPEVSAEFATYLGTIREQYESRWLQDFIDLGLSPTEAAICLDLSIATTKTLAQYWLKGEISREEAVQTQMRSLIAILRATLDSH
ncbi:MAG: TetR/AcrR family transcriptional regulator [Planctomycetota bacterium]